MNASRDDKNLSVISKIWRRKKFNCYHIQEDSNITPLWTRACKCLTVKWPLFIDCHDRWSSATCNNRRRSLHAEAMVISATSFQLTHSPWLSNAIVFKTRIVLSKHYSLCKFTRILSCGALLYTRTCVTVPRFIQMKNNLPDVIHFFNDSYKCVPSGALCSRFNSANFITRSFIILTFEIIQFLINYV